MALQPKLITVAECEKFLDRAENRHRCFELIDGAIVEKVPTEEQGLIAGNMYGFLWQYTRQSGFGRAVIEVRGRMPEDDCCPPPPWAAPGWGRHGHSGTRTRSAAQVTT